MKRVLIAALLALAPALAHGQQGTPDPARRAAMIARRDSLEAEVVQKFVERLTRDLRLDADQRARTERVLKENGVRRRELARASMELRGRMHHAARNAATTDAEFAALLAEHEVLRGREHDLWRRDQEDLAGILSPRQRVQFLTSWAHFQDDMREILSRRMREQGTPRDRGSDGVSH